MMDIPCYDDLKKYCPYRINDLEKKFCTCNYPKLYAELLAKEQFDRIPSLVNRACELIRKEELRLESIREISSKKTQDFLKNAEIGDMVFCKIESPPEVKLLEKPLDDSKFVSCQKSNGKIIRVQACHLYRISKGNYHGEFFLEGSNNNKKVQELKYRAEYYGFRTEVEERKEGFLLKIYGDSQQEVDEFINLFIKQGFELTH